MRKKLFKTIWTTIIIVLIGFSLTTCNKEDETDPDGVKITSNKLGAHDGYNYEFWTDDRGAGSGSMTLTGNGSFFCRWDNTYNILFRMGKRYGSSETRNHTQIGNFSLEYGFSDYSPTGTSYVTVYGWTRNPLVEFYIVENWGSNGYKGYSANSHTKKGEITVNGGTYDIYESTRTNQPSIEGNKTFKQYWSIRRSARSSGTISISDHFKAWQNAGLNMTGGFYEVALCVEAYGGSARNASGKANVHTNKLMVNGVEINK